MPPVIDREKCTGCGTCAEICPVQVFRHHKDNDKIPEVKFRASAGTATPACWTARPGPFPSPFRFPACCCMWTHRH